MDKSSLSERDICSKFITPALERAGWDVMRQIREEVSLTRGRIIVRGKLVARGKVKRANYVLYYKPNLPITVIEAKDNHHAVGDGMQQVLSYATRRSCSPASVIPAKAGSRGQEAGANIRVANGPKGMRQEPHVIQSLWRRRLEDTGPQPAPG